MGTSDEHVRSASHDGGSAEVRRAYTRLADAYIDLVDGSLDRLPDERADLDRFAALVRDRTHPIADLGCGPGYVTAYLADRGLRMVGYDLTPAFVERARFDVPEVEFRVADITALDPALRFGGIVGRYSLIHLDPTRLEDVLADWHRRLEPGGVMLLGFFAAATADAHGAPFDHKVTTAYALHPGTVAGMLDRIGAVDIDVQVRPPRPGERPLDHATVLATTPTAHPVSGTVPGRQSDQ